MKKIPEYTEERGAKLAEQVVEDMEIRDLVDFVKDELRVIYRENYDSFVEDWEIHNDCQA